MLSTKIILGVIRNAFAYRVNKALAIFAGLLYAAFYLFATGIVAYYPDKDISKYVQVPYLSVLLSDSQGWSPQYPWVISYPTNHTVVSLPFWALLSTILLALLLACNVALMGYMILKRWACGKKTYAGILGIIPGSFGIAGCCSPTLLSIIGLAGLTGVMWKLTAFLTIGSIGLLLGGIYFASRSIVCQSKVPETM